MGKLYLPGVFFASPQTLIRRRRSDDGAMPQCAHKLKSDIYLQKENPMNNNLYHWHNERMVDLEMQEIRRELAQANLFRASGGAEAGWIARLLGGLLNLFKSRSQRIDQRSHASRRYKATH
jgi:hypothetical protein